jgi:biopolymer transport protein ExbD
MGQLLQASDPLPMMEMNTTPLIDVMLVLLIMFIITIPVQTHAVKLDLPKACASCPLPDAAKNEVTITRSGAILWNGQAISRDDLAFLLARTQRMHPIPELHLRPDAAARYETVDDVLAITKHTQVKRMGFVGNEAYVKAF